MKVKELIEILKEHDQEAIVCFDEYIGCDTPTLEVQSVEFFHRGRRVNGDSSSLTDDDGKAKFNLIKFKTE